MLTFFQVKQSIQESLVGNFDNYLDSTSSSNTVLCTTSNDDNGFVNYRVLVVVNMVQLLEVIR